MRSLDLRQVDHPRTTVLKRRQRVPPAILEDLAPVNAELFLGERQRPEHPVASDPAAPATGSAAVLNPDDLRGERGPAEGAQNAAVMDEVAIVIGGPLPDANGGQVRRLGRRALPLVARAVEDAV